MQMTQLPEPTFWEWVGFAITMACLFYALVVVILDRLPDWLSEGLRHLLFHHIPALLAEGLRLLGWAFGWLGAFYIWVLSAGRIDVVGDMLGRRQQPTPVNTFVPPSSRYVAPPDDDDPEERNETPVAATDNGSLRLIAMSQSERNEPLPRNVVTRAQADIIARLVKSGSLYTPDGRGGYKALGQTALIRLALGLEPNGRPDSDYGQLKAELDPLLKAELTIGAGRADERTIAK
jgi:hypothetical protein